MVRCPKATEVARASCPAPDGIRSETEPRGEPGATSTSPKEAEARPRLRTVRGITDLSGMYTVTFGRSAVAVLVDCMNSVMCGKDRVISGTRFKKVNDRYADLFARMTACWQRVVYLISPPGHFWRIVDSHRYDLARA